MAVCATILVIHPPPHVNTHPLGTGFSSGSVSAIIRFWRSPRLPPSDGKVSFMQGDRSRNRLFGHAHEEGLRSRLAIGGFRMKLSAPVYRLKRKAKLASRALKIPLHEALERVAAEEGYASWSLLIARRSASAPAGKLYPYLAGGDLLLLAARPGHGKTLMSLELAIEAMKSGHRSVFFTLDYVERDVLGQFSSLGVDPAQFADRFEFDASDLISADYIMRRLAAAPRDTFVVVDYLQLLDQRRENPDLMLQVCALRSFARERGLVMVFLSQIDRSYDPVNKPCPDIADVRLPNPLDLALFDKTCFLNDGEVRFDRAA
jgi:hypothetical protein